MNLLFLALTSIAFLSLAAAETIPCAGGTLSNYTAAGFTCSIDELTFSGFSYNPTASGGAGVPDAGGVDVNPEKVGIESGFLFTAGWLVSEGQVEDSTIIYTATCHQCLIDDVVLVMGGGAHISGTASVSETSVTPFVSLLTGGSVLSDMTTISPGVSTITITKDIGVSGGTAPDGLAHISTVNNLFSTNVTTATPEPSLGLLCLGVFALIPVARRKLRRL
jgi:hypothetical protein